MKLKNRLKKFRKWIRAKNKPFNNKKYTKAKQIMLKKKRGHKIGA